MTPFPSPPNDPAVLPPPVLDREQVLVRASSPPPLPVDIAVDIRPGAVATFDGDRVRLALSVDRRESRTAVDWADGPALEAAVEAGLQQGAAAVRFGDRRAVSSTLGVGHARAIERRVGATAQAYGATLVTWTSEARRTLDTCPYDLFVDGTASRVG